MDKLYKIFVFFMVLFAVNIQVQAQSGVFYSFLSSGADSATDQTIANYYANNHTDVYADDYNLALVPTFSTSKEVVNFTNYPNPVVSSTTIAYTLTAKATVNLRVIDLAGRQLAVLVNQEQAAGKQELFWELRKNNITSGMYILVLQVENKVYSRKIIVQ